MRVFITGGTGFFGQAVYSHLRSFGVETVILSRTCTGKGYLTGDVRTVEFPDEQFDYVLHMSMETSGTDRVIDFARRCGAKKLLYVSSGAVVHMPCTEYAQAKRRAEFMCLESGVPVSIARCYAFVGPHMPQDRNFAIQEFIRNAVRGKDIEVKGSAIRSYLYTSDLAEWLFVIAVHGTNGDIFEVGSEHEISTPDLALLVKEIVNPDVRVVVTGTGGTRYVPETFMTKILMGLKQKVGLREAIQRTADSMET